MYLISTDLAAAIDEANALLAVLADAESPEVLKKAG
jgi:hypothetical protein